MILNLINQQNQLKSQRKKFIPFVNERNHMGNIIKTKQKQKSAFKTIQVFQNLKKSTQQYFFDKKYQKMKSKLERYKNSLFKQKQIDYDLQVRRCFESLQKFHRMKENDDEKQNYFINLNEKLNDNIKSLREQIRFNKTKEHLTQKKNTSPLKKIYSSYCSLIVKNQENSHLNHHKTTNLQNIQLNIINQQNLKKSKTLLYKNNMMKDFIKCNQKFQGYITKERHNPWKKWYKQSQVQIFPGKTIKMKILEKSIY